MRGAIPSLPQYAFMVWLKKANGQLFLNLYILYRTEVTRGVQFRRGQ